MTKFCLAAMRTLTLGMLLAIAGSATGQQAYPTKAIHFIVPYPPAGSTDPMARMVAQKLASKWGQPVIVDNRPGGNTIIGTEIVAKAAPDGYTILLASPIFVASPGLLPLPYDTIKDFTPVATIAKNQIVLVLNPALPANSLKEFIALAKSKPGQLNYASTGVGGIVHLSAELFCMMTGTKLQHIPYKGAVPLMTDLIGGQVDLSFQTTIATIPHIRSGKIKAIAVTGDRRLSALPEVPTYAEAGLPGYGIAGWMGIVAPAGTPKPITDKISNEVAAILAMPEIVEYLAKQGMEPFVSTPAQFAALIKSEIAMYTKIIKTANVKLDQ